MDTKHLVAAIVGVALGIAGAVFGIDFTKSCPATAPAGVVAPAVIK